MAAAAHNLLGVEELLARGFAEGEELLLPVPADDDSDEGDGDFGASGLGGDAQHPGLTGSSAVVPLQEEAGVGVGADVADQSPCCQGGDSQEPIPDGMEGQVREVPEGPLGMQVFPASRVLLRWLLSHPKAPCLEGATVLELGAGTGALAMGLVTAATGAASRVYATEGDAEVLANLEFNIAANGLTGRIIPVRWDWEVCRAPPIEVDLSQVDIVLASDVVYVGTAEEELSAALAMLCARESSRGPSLEAWLLLADRPPGGQEFLPRGKESQDPGTRAVERFLAACSSEGLEVEQLELTPDFIEDSLRSKGSGRPDGELCLYRLRRAGAARAEGVATVETEPPPLPG